MSHKLLSKCDDAVVAYLIGSGVGSSSNVFSAKSCRDLPVPPFVGVISERAVETVTASGNYTVSVSVEVHTNAALASDQDPDELKTAAVDLVEAVGDALHDAYEQDGSSLGELLSGEGVTIQNVFDRGIEQARGEREGEWIDTFNLELICWPS